MSAIAAQYASALDRRYAEHAAHYDPAAFFSYSHHPVPAPPPALDHPAYNNPAYAWDDHDQSSSYSTSSSAANPHHYSSSPAIPGPSSLHNYPSDYSSHRSLLPPRNTPAFSVPAPAPSPSAPAPAPRDSYASGPRSYSALAAAAAVASVSPSDSPSRLQNAQWDEAALYTIEPADPGSPPPTSPASTRATPSIKEEDPEGSFIIEVSVPADQPVTSPMPEVPLRATHAPPKMRKMMCTFRLENFAMHDGIRSAATQPGPGGIEVGPLKDRPVMLEWQVDLNEPLVPQDDVFQYGASPSSAAKASSSSSSSSSSRPSDLLRPHSSPSPRLSSRVLYESTSSPSPSLSLEYPTAVDNDSWDAASSGYGSVADPSTGTASGMGGSPTFTSVMTPAQSLAWNMRYSESDVGLESASSQSSSQSQSYRRPGSVQSSLSRVSQAHGHYVFGGSSKPAYPQASQYGHGHDASAGFARANAAVGSGRYQDVYASTSSSASAWYRSS